VEPEPADAPDASAPRPEPQADFLAFWEQHYRYYVRVLMAVGATLEDAHDTISAVFVDMLKKQTWDTLITNPKAWIRSAILHSYYDWRRRERRRLELEIKGHLTPESYIDDGLNA
jgi:DNA-directed RNA polymerase specialized sigma24 family protein